MKITVTATKEGEEPVTRETVTNARIDALVKRIPGLTSREAYELKVKRELVREEAGWVVTIRITE